MRGKMILSLQGCMAVGKTTAIKYLQKNAPYINVSYEDHTDVIEEVKRAWFIGRENVDVLRVDDLSAEEVGQKVKEWCDVYRG